MIIFLLIAVIFLAAVKYNAAWTVLSIDEYFFAYNIVIRILLEFFTKFGFVWLAWSD